MSKDKIFVARYSAKRLLSDDLVSFADRKLSEGTYSDKLLAIVDEDDGVWESISNLFEEAMKEIGLRVPTFEEAIWQLLNHHINLISLGQVDPLKQFRKLLLDIEAYDLHENVSEYVGDSLGIEHLYGTYYSVDELDSENYTIEDIRAEMIEESKKWIESYPL